jgi:ribonuclease E
MTAELPVGETISEEAGAVAKNGEEAGVVNDIKPPEHKKKRRRRRRRGKGGAGEVEGAAEAAASAPEPATEAQPAFETQPEPATGEEKDVGHAETAVAEPVKKTRRKQAPRKKKVLADELVEGVEKTSE